MSRNLSDSKQERDLLNRLSKLEQQLRERGTLQRQGDDAISMSTTGPISLTTSTPIVSNTRALAKFSLSNSEGKMVFANFRFTIYVANTADPAWRIPDNSIAAYWITPYHWTDWAQTDESTQGLNQVDYILLENSSAFDLDVTVAGEWKYIVNGGEAVVQ